MSVMILSITTNNQRQGRSKRGDEMKTFNINQEPSNTHLILRTHCRLKPVTYIPKDGAWKEMQHGGENCGCISCFIERRDK